MKQQNLFCFIFFVGAVIAQLFGCGMGSEKQKTAISLSGLEMASTLNNLPPNLCDPELIDAIINGEFPDLSHTANGIILIGTTESECFDAINGDNDGDGISDGEERCNETLGAYVEPGTLDLVVWSDGENQYCGCRCGPNCETTDEDAIHYSAYGSGLPADPFEITTQAQLASIAADEAAWDKYFLQCADIDLDYDTSFPHFKIGRCDLAFVGGYDGGDFEIRDFVIDTTDPLSENLDPGCNALFGHVRGEAILQRIHMAAASVNDDTQDGLGASDAALMVGRLDDDVVIEHSSVRGAVINQWGRGTGLLIGTAYSHQRLNDVEAVGSVWAGSGVAGVLAGALSYEGTTTRAKSAGQVDGSAPYACGGLVGRNYGFIRYSESEANVLCGTRYAGGLLGFSDGVVDHCQATGTLYGSSVVPGPTPGHGGLIGYVQGADIRFSWADVDVFSSVNNVGGFVGYVSSGDLNDNYALGAVFISPAAGEVDTLKAGGFAGYLRAGANARNYTTSSVWIFNVPSTVYAGGFAGELHESASIVDSFATDRVYPTTLSSAPFAYAQSIPDSCYYNSDLVSGGAGEGSPASETSGDFIDPNAAPLSFNWSFEPNAWVLSVGEPPTIPSAGAQ